MRTRVCAMVHGGFRLHMSKAYCNDKLYGEEANVTLFGWIGDFGPVQFFLGTASN